MKTNTQKNKLKAYNDAGTTAPAFNFEKMSAPELRERSNVLNVAMEEIEAKYEDDAAWKDEDTKAYSAALAEAEALNAHQESRPENLRNRREAMNVVPQLATLGSNLGALNTHLSVRSRIEDDPRGGFQNDNDFLRGVQNLFQGELENERVTSPELRKAVINAIGDDEYAAGRWEDGIPVPKGFMNSIIRITPEDDPLLGSMTTIPMQGASMDIPAAVDKDHSTSFTGGTSVLRRSETQAKGYTKDKFEAITMKPAELIGQSAVTKEMLHYSPISIPALIQNSMDLAFQYRRRDEIISGDGNGKYLGFLNPGNKAVVDVVTRGNASTDIFTGEDVLAMRKHVFQYENAVWVFNFDMYEHVAQLHIESPNAAGLIKMFSPATGGAPDLLLGRPVVFTEFMPGIQSSDGVNLEDWGEAATSKRYAACVNMSHYYHVQAYTDQQQSAHVRFEAREEVFQFVMADDARPSWKTYLTPKKGLTKRSPFVAAVGTGA